MAKSYDKQSNDGFTKSGEKNERAVWSARQVFDYLEISVHDAVLVTMIDALQDLLDAVGSVRLAVEFSGHNVLEELTARHPVRDQSNIQSQKSAQLCVRLAR